MERKVARYENRYWLGMVIENSIELFHNLKALTLIDNRLKAFPSGIGALKKLENLYLSEKQLDLLPGSFYELPLKNIWLEPTRRSPTPIHLYTFTP